MSAAPLLDVVDVSKAYRLPRPRPFAPHPLRPALNGVSFAVARGPVVRHRRRIGVGQVDPRPHRARARPARFGRGQARRAVAVRPRPGGAARHAGAHADDLSGPVRLARSAHAGRADRGRAARRARPGLAGRAARPGRRAASVRGAPAGGRAKISARVLGRTATADRHRPRPDHPAEARRRRRAGLRARRLGPGAGPEPDERPHARVGRHLPADQPRPRASSPTSARRRR